ncbi:MAG: hypothetical protein LQ341_000647 [Variospora aurantia]|nr:MAG: hypothetical protein LQ341_000647 [Variospora aurantia]
MEPDKAAAVAALAVALLAFLVASAQAIQQYFVSGQLIRLCDSVVYNQMPGQGRRIWQFSQFRFRVVYSIPQVRLLPDLWRSTAAHVQSLPLDAAMLPALSVQKSKSCLSALAGEASWVSFVRIAQPSSGASLRYTMVEGDADRCPSDLPVVPMQLSMRDIVVMAVMAGMECTDVSFKAQSISMQGDAGTITSSRHPVLGALVHFAPKQHFEQYGMQALNSKVHPDWLARMLDVVAVAGRRFDLQDRKHYEDDEGNWIKSSSSRAPLQDTEIVGAGALASTGTLRHRRGLKIQKSSAAGEQAPMEDEQGQSTWKPQRDPTMAGDSKVYRRVQDGQWFFSPSSESKVNENYQLQIRHEFAMRANSPKPAIRKPKVIPDWIRRVFPTAGTERLDHILPTSEARHGNIVESLRNHSVGIVPTVWRRNKLKIVEKESAGGALYVQALHRPDTASSLASERLKEQNGSPQIKSQQADEAKLGNSQSQLLLTNGDRCTGQLDLIPNPLSSPGKTMEAQRSRTRDDFVTDRWQQTFRQRRNERSRGRSQRQVERSLVLRQRPTPNSRLDPSVYERRKQRKKQSSRSPKLALDNSLFEKTGEPGDTGSDPDMSKTLLQSRHGRPARAPGSVRNASRPQQWHLYDHVTGRRSSLSSSSDSITDTRRRSPSHQVRKKPRKGSSTHPRGSISSDQDRPRGRRRNSSLATTSLENRTQRNSAQIESRSPLQGAKRVRVLLPEEDMENPPPLELSPRSGSFSPQMKPVLRAPTERFPEDPYFVRPGVARVDQARVGSTIPEGARWTKIDRGLVCPEALEAGRERFEERKDYLVVLRVLTREEIQQYANLTQDIRANWVQRTSEAYESAQPGTESAHYTEDSELTPDPLGRDRHQSVVPESSATAIDSFKSRNADDTAKSHMEIIQPRTVIDKFPITKRTISRREAARGGRRYHEAVQGIPTERKNSELERPLGPSPVVHPAEQHLEHENGDSYIRPPVTLSRQQNSTSRHRSSQDHGVLTYDEELLFLHSDSILKKLQSCTEQCKDVITTFDVCISVQPDFGNNVKEICQLVKRCNTLLKDLLLTVNPLRDNKKAAEIIVADLDILWHGLQASLDILRSEFDLFDITHVTSDAREIAWWNTLSAFEEKFQCSMPDSLDLVQRFAKEISANFRIGVFKSPESALLKERVAHASGHDTLPSSLSSPAEEISPDPSRFGFHSRPSILHSPSRYVRSPSRSTLTGSPRRQHLDLSGRNHESIRKKKDGPRATSRREAAHTDMIHNTQYVDDSSADDWSSSTATLTSWESNITGQVSWFWVSQADVLPGYFATPWKSMFSEATCLGAISVSLKTIERLTTNSSLRYVASHDECKDWLRLGKTTYPSYAHAANGGIVVAGVYEPVKFEGFDSAVAPLRMLKSYDFQTGRSYQTNPQAVVECIAELMSLDSWLSICGRTREIIGGPSRLLQSLPTLIQRMMKDFDLEFSRVDRAPSDGGLRIIKTISGSLLQFLQEQDLSKAERLFALVALLRTAKMALGMARGSDTTNLRDVLVHDVQVYMA